MENLSLNEFQKFIESTSPTIFVFDSSNQAEFGNENLKIIAEYDKEIASEATHTIYLEGHSGNMRINGVRTIHYAGKDNPIGPILEIVCEGSREDSKDVSYFFTIKNK